MIEQYPLHCRNLFLHSQGVGMCFFFYSTEEENESDEWMRGIFQNKWPNNGCQIGTG